MKFYKAVLKPVKDPLHYAYGVDLGTTIDDHMYKDGKCPDCGKDEWWFLPKESSAVREGGKPYIQCIGCGCSAHL